MHSRFVKLSAVLAFVAFAALTGYAPAAAPPARATAMGSANSLNLTAVELP